MTPARSLHRGARCPDPGLFDQTIAPPQHDSRVAVIVLEWHLPQPPPPPAHPPAGPLRPPASRGTAPRLFVGPFPRRYNYHYNCLCRCPVTFWHLAVARGPPRTARRLVPQACQRCPVDLHPFARRPTRRRSRLSGGRAVGHMPRSIGRRTGGGGAPEVALRPNGADHCRCRGSFVDDVTSAAVVWEACAPPSTPHATIAGSGVCRARFVADVCLRHV